MDEVSQPTNPNKILKLSRPGGPVTCVSLPSPNLIISARGSFLEKQTSLLKQQLLVFPRGGTIQGIRYRDDITRDIKPWDAVVFGGRLLAFCSVLFNDSEAIMKRLTVTVNNEASDSHLIISDWIWDVKCIAEQSNSDITKTTVAVGLARHVIELWEVMDSTSDAVRAARLRRIKGVPSCLVTSMHLMSTGNELLVASGTAFHEIRVWAYNMTEGNPNSTESIVEPKSHCLKGHAGVVHCVKFSSDCLSLASTSDDRSVRFWRYNRKEDEWKLSWVGWGHAARVWSVAFIPSLELVASTGEDGSIRLWSCSSGESIGFVQHACPLWSIACFDDFAVVGGNDGAVNLYDVSNRLAMSKRLARFDAVPVPDDRPKPHVDCNPNDENEEKPDKKKKKKKKKKINNAQVIVGLQWERISDDASTLLVATRAGSLMRLNIGKNQWQMINPWWVPSLQGSYNILPTDGCCLAVHADVAAIGTNRGDIVLAPLSGSTEKPTKVLSGRTLRSVQGLKWVNGSTLISFHVRAVALWALEQAQVGNHESDLEPTCVFGLDETAKGVPMSCAFDPERNTMIVGDSRGNLTLFHLNGQTESRMVQPSSILYRAHQKEHVTDIVLKEDRVLSVGNDGCLHTSYIVDSGLKRGWSAPASSMTGICQILEPPIDSSSICIAGYYGNTFRIIEMATGHEFFHFDTGGRQRQHHCSVKFASPTISDISQCGMVVCMNQKDGTNSLLISHLSSRKSKLNFPICTGAVSLHSETIFSACFFSILQARFLLTGSEDCTSKISFCGTENLEDSLGLTPQESCVRAVCSSQFDDSSALVVVGGGKLIVQFFLIHANGSQPSRTNDLKINFMGQLKNRDKASIDHRINDVNAIPLKGTSRKHLVVAGDSDGCCHIFVVPEDAQDRVSPGVLLSTSQRPILCIDMVPVAGRILATIGTTGGDVLLYDLPSTDAEISDGWNNLKDTWTPIGTYKAHQMGTNAVHSSLKKAGDIVRICTGGDDQSLCVCDLSLSLGNDGRLSLASDPYPRVTKEVSFSALKGVHQFSSSGKDYVFAVGYSQQLSLWELDTKGQPLLQDRVPVDLGDVNCLAVDHSGPRVDIAVGGLGIEKMSLQIDV